jgi:hypothetical protein
VKSISRHVLNDIYLNCFNVKEREEGRDKNDDRIVK